MPVKGVVRTGSRGAEREDLNSRVHSGTQRCGTGFGIFGFLHFVSLIFLFAALFVRDTFLNSLDSVLYTILVCFCASASFTV